MDIKFFPPEVQKEKKKELNKKDTKKKEYYCLPVYKKAVDLVRQLYSSTLNAPTYLRIGLLKDEKEMILRIIFLIQEAASVSDKLNKYNAISEAYLKAKEILVWNRLLFDLKIFSANVHAIISSYGEDLKRLLYGWLKSVESVAETS